MTQAIPSFGTLLKMGDSLTPETFTTIAEVGDIELPGINADTEDVTVQTSPGAVKEFVCTLLDAGEVTFPINWVPTDPTHDHTTGLLAQALDRETRNFQAVLPDAGGFTIQFSACVTKFGPPKAPVAGVLQADITLKVSGLPNYTA